MTLYKNPDQIKIDEALDLITQYGGIDGSHHKQWVLDQVVRVLTGSDDAYNAWCEAYRGEWNEVNEEYEYEWDVGIAP